MADRLPPGPSAIVTLLARSSPTGKFTVDGEALVVGVGDTVTQPAPVWAVTVTLPVTATASAGNPSTPATCQVLGTPAEKAPDSPVPNRLSSTRTGLTATNVVSIGGGGLVGNAIRPTKPPPPRAR